MTELLRVSGLEVEFRLHDVAIAAVRGVSFRVREGSTVALVGESGSGKSVVSQAIMGILPANGRVRAGRILFSDPERRDGAVDLVGLGPDSKALRTIRGARIGIVFQEPTASLSPLHTIGDQVSEALLVHDDVGRRGARERTVEMLGLVGVPEPERALDLYPFELSGGLRQRATIAMALICRPALLIADEPTTALDVTVQAQILKLLKDLQGDLGMAVLMITHDLGVVANLAEEVVIVYQGRVLESGTVDDIFERPAHPYTKALLGAVPRLDLARDERLRPVREVRHRAPTLRQAEREGRRTAGPLLEVRDVGKTFRTRKAGWFGFGPPTTVTAVDGVSFDIARGRCFGLVGESGSGKTTVGKIVMRAVRADQGRVLYYDGDRAVDVCGLSDADLVALRRKIQLIFQDPFSSLNPRMTVLDIIREPLVAQNLGDRASQIDFVAELMDAVGLDRRFLRRYPHSFSGGQRQRIGIARALALKPELLICDEPVSALDVSVQAQVLNLLKDLQGELGLTYLFISHDLAVINYVADHIAVMCRGRLVEVAPREALFSAPVHPYTKALVAAIPSPDLRHKLDFRSVTAGVSEPAAWPPPFTARNASAARRLIDVGGGHRVLAAADATAVDLAP